MSEEARECERDSRARPHTHTLSLSLLLSVRILRETNNNTQRRHRRYRGYPQEPGATFRVVAWFSRFVCT
jgi:hypothetical protein